MNYKKLQQMFTFFGILVVLFNVYELFAGHFPLNQSLVFIVEGLAGIVLIYLPEIARKVIKVELPDPIVYFYWFFLLISVFLGTCLHLILNISFWDKILHSVSPMVLTAVGYGLIAMFLKKNTAKDVSPWLFLLFGFAFAGLCGVFWEFWEFLCDSVANMNLQRYMTTSGKPFIGRDALMDTMGDLFTNTLGALLMGIYAFIQNQRDKNHFETYRIRKIEK